MEPNTCSKKKTSIKGQLRAGSNSWVKYLRWKAKAMLASPIITIELYGKKVYLPKPGSRGGRSCTFLCGSPPSPSGLATPQLSSGSLQLKSAAEIHTETGQNHAVDQQHQRRGAKGRRKYEQRRVDLTHQ